MTRKFTWLSGLAATGIALLIVNLPLHAQTDAPADAGSEQTATPTPIFRFPVVPDVEISGYFDHDPASQSIQFYDGRVSTGGNGFAFSCPSIGDAWVGCQDAAAGEPACSDDRELWYDDHHGTDFEYAAEWRTGASCDLSKFSAMEVIVYAPAPGLVDFVGEDDPYNGNYVLLYHDLNGDQNYYNDDLRSYYLHFADNGVLVDEGQVVALGDPLGYGGATGLAWTPHLHFEVQQRTELGWVAVDPFGWLSSATDPWYVPSRSLK
jgi:hypothetical protein